VAEDALRELLRPPLRDGSVSSRSTSHGQVLPQGWVNRKGYRKGSAKGWGKGGGKGPQRTFPDDDPSRSDPPHLTILGRCSGEFQALGRSCEELKTNNIADILRTRVQIHVGQDVHHFVHGVSVVTALRIRSCDGVTAEEWNHLGLLFDANHHRNFPIQRIMGHHRNTCTSAVLENGKVLQASEFDCLIKEPLVGVNKSSDVEMNGNIISHPQQRFGLSFVQFPSSRDGLGLTVKLLGHWAHTDSFLLGLTKAGCGRMTGNISDLAFFFSPRSGTMVGQDGSNFSWGTNVAAAIGRRLLEEGAEIAEGHQFGHPKCDGKLEFDYGLCLGFTGREPQTITRKAPREPFLGNFRDWLGGPQEESLKL
jgi:hypothetical protein